MRVKVAFVNKTKFVIGNGATTRFWEDTWLGETPLRFNIRFFMVLFNDVMSLLQRYYNLFPLIFSLGER